MASFIYNRLKANLLNEIDIEADTIKVALMKAAHSASTADDDVLTDVSANELANGNGYTTGGATLAGSAITQGILSDGSVTRWTATDTAWTTATFTAYYAVIYDSTATDNLILSIDFGPLGVTVANGTLTIDWNAGGILTLL